MFDNELVFEDFITEVLKSFIKFNKWDIGFN